MGLFNPGTLAGYQERSLESEREKLASEEARRKNLAGMYERLSQDESLRPEVKSEYEQRLATIYLTPFDKKLPKDYDRLITEVPTGIEQPKPGQTLSIPPSEPPSDLPPLLQSLDLPGSEVQAPGGPSRQPARYTYDEMLNRQLGALGQELNLRGDIGLEQQLAERAAIPENPQLVEGKTGAGTLSFFDRDPRTGQVKLVEGMQPTMSGTITTAPGTTSGANLIDQFPTDLVGNPTDPEQEYKIRLRGEEPVGIIPVTASEPLVQVFQPDGSVAYVPRSQAAGSSAPRTTYDLSGMPSTGGQTGMSMGAPPTVSDATQAEIAGTRQAVTDIDQIIPQIVSMEETFGPLAGRVTLAEVERLGGMGATKDQQELAIDLRRLVMTQAFENGGKQLTPTEKEEFLLLLPKLSDQLDLAMTKAVAAREYLANKYQNRLDVMPVRQRGQLNAPPLPALAGTRVYVIDGDGNRFSIPAEQLEDFLESTEGQGFRRVQ